MECKERIDVEKWHLDCQKKLLDMKYTLAKETDGVTFTKWKMELLNFDLTQLLYNQRIGDWPIGIKDVYIKHFNEEIPTVKPKQEDVEEELTEKEIESR